MRHPYFDVPRPIVFGHRGASAAAVSIIAGAGECLGYGLRFVAGSLADRTGKYWPITFAGYAVNLLAVPAMALAPGWQAAGALILAERIGRAFRKPTVEAMLPVRGERCKVPIEDGGRYLVNCGAVGQPRDSDPRAAFGLLDATSRVLTIVRTPYDLGAAQKKILEAGLPPVLAQRLALGR